MKFLDSPPRFLFFTGKGGAGKTSVACATALHLVSQGKRVLLVSTDPASNVSQVLGVTIGNTVTPIEHVPGLSAMEIDPEQAAEAYRERIIAPVRGLLPDKELASITEQLSGSCTTEVASFDEFTDLLADESLTDEYDHVVFDTAPTGHTIRLLQLPGSWTDFLEAGKGDASCLGPLSGLEKQRTVYAQAVNALKDPAMTRLVLVARAQASSLAEIDRTYGELSQIGITGEVRRRQRRSSGHRRRRGPRRSRARPGSRSHRRDAGRDRRPVARRDRAQGLEHGRRPEHWRRCSPQRRSATASTGNRRRPRSRLRLWQRWSTSWERRSRAGHVHGQGRRGQDHHRRSHRRRPGPPRPRGAPDHDRSRRPPHRHTERQRPRAGCLTHRPGRGHPVLPRSRDGHQGQEPRRCRTRHPRRGPALPLHRGGRGLPAVLKGGHGVPAPIRRHRHRANRSHPAAAGRRRVLPPADRPPDGRLHAVCHAAHALAGRSSDQGHPRDPGRAHPGHRGARAPGGPRAGRDPSLGLGHQQLDRRRAPRNRVPASSRRR